MCALRQFALPTSRQSVYNHKIHQTYDQPLEVSNLLWTVGGRSDFNLRGGGGSVSTMKFDYMAQVTYHFSVISHNLDLLLQSYLECMAPHTKQYGLLINEACVTQNVPSLIRTNNLIVPIS